jgi:hypothetical protein
MKDSAASCEVWVEMVVPHRTCLVLALFGATSEVEADPCTPAIHGRNLPQQWREVVDLVNGELTMRTDIERCVDIDVQVDPDRHASVVVTLGERRAFRAVADPSDLRSTVLALLLDPQPALPDVGAQPDTIDGSERADPESARKRARTRDPIEHDLAARIIVPNRAAAPSQWTSGSRSERCGPTGEPIPPSPQRFESLVERGRPAWSADSQRRGDRSRWRQTGARVRR